MAPVGDKPFLHYIFRYLQREGIEEVVLSVGYRWEAIRDYFGEQYGAICIRYAVETEPLGTGGGIRLALDQVKRDCYIINGDTFFDVPLAELAVAYYEYPTSIALSLKPMRDFDRYGTVQLDQWGWVSAFIEKQPHVHGLINGGVYLFQYGLFENMEQIDKKPLPNKFSFESLILEPNPAKLCFRGCIYDRYFIDIGVPEEYARAQQELMGLAL
jgi:D-glycero-alpha-D-manno-heptose 1-phosphate guanylyltransferase